MYLEKLRKAKWKKGDSDTCVTCEQHGACQEWVISMAEDAGVPVEWLARCVLDHQIHYDHGVDEVKQRYADRFYMKAWVEFEVVDNFGDAISPGEPIDIAYGDTVEEFAMSMRDTSMIGAEIADEEFAGILKSMKEIMEEWDDTSDT